MQDKTERNGIFNLKKLNVKEFLLKKNVIFAVGIIGILLIFLVDFTPEKTASVQPISTDDYCREYAADLEKRLTEIISSIEGAGQVKVMVTMETGEQYVYARTEKTDNDYTQRSQQDITEKQVYQSDYIIIENINGEKQALTETTLQPQIKGVAVVCSGADDIKVVKNITEMVSVVTNVPTNRICVIKMI